MEVFRTKTQQALTYFAISICLLMTACNNLSIEKTQTSTPPVLHTSQNQSVDDTPIKVNWSLIYLNSIALLTKQTGIDNQSNEYLSTDQIKLINIDYIYRKQVALSSLEYNYAAKQLEDQLKGRIVDSYWSNKEDEVKLFLVTRMNVVADEHNYVFRYGELAGFIVSFVILPIADRSKEDMIAIYSGDENIISISNLIEQYGGKLQSVGYSSEGFKIIASTYFPEKQPNKNQIQQLESQLKQLTGVTIEIEENGELFF